MSPGFQDERNGGKSGSMRTKAGVTVTEIVIALAIIALLAALLLPTISAEQERSHRSICASNMKNLMSAILMYASDNNDALPISWNIMAQVGPKVAADSHGALPRRGLYMEILPYVKDRQVLICPDDKGIEVDPNNPAANVARVPFLDARAGSGPDQNAVEEPLGTPAYQIFGMSYKATKQNFTFLSGYGGQHYKCAGQNDACLGPATGKKPTDPSLYQILPPNPMTLSFFARPAQTRVLRDFLSIPGETEKWARPSTTWHPDGETIGFADGHVGLVRDPSGEGQFCDGPTSSPNYDGSCNVKGLERFS